MELGVIAKMNFPGYFLIVWDFIRYAKENGIPVGPGRGSGAGSIVAYSMRITDLDPIPYHLLFERFLNPERVSMPDFDVDFCMDRRDQVIAYVQNKLRRGQRRADRDVRTSSRPRASSRTSRARSASPPIEAQKIANLIPRKSPGRDLHHRRERSTVEPKLKARYDTEPLTRRAPRPGAEARGADAPRRQARGRHRHQRGAALGPRPGLPRRQERRATSRSTTRRTSSTRGS